MGLFDSLFGSGRTRETFKVGDHVRVVYRGQEGWIIDQNGNTFMVSINDGQVVESYEASELEKCW